MNRSIVLVLAITSPAISGELLKSGWKDQVLPTSARSADAFGSALAVTQKYMIVGAKRDDETGKGSGAAYIFEHSGNAWVQVSKLRPPTASLSGAFGAAVGISGNTVVVGAPQDSEKMKKAGAVYIFDRVSSGWLQSTRLAPADLKAGDGFGYSVAIDGDAMAVGVGHRKRASSGGTVYIFRRVQGAWVIETRLDGTLDANEMFGYSVSLRGDTILIGAPGRSDSNSPGAAYTFSRRKGAWVQQTRMVAEATVPGEYFGYSVALNDDISVVGSRRMDETCCQPGAAYVFRRRGDDWIQEAHLKTPGPRELFGWSVASFGPTIAVAAWSDRVSLSGSVPGSVYLFKRLERDWVSDQRLVADQSNHFDLLTSALALDGTDVAVGARLRGSDATYVGAVFTYSTSEARQEATRRHGHAGSN